MDTPEQIAAKAVEAMKKEGKTDAEIQKFSDGVDEQIKRNSRMNTRGVRAIRNATNVEGNKKNKKN